MTELRNTAAECARPHVGDDIELRVFDAQAMPSADASFDVVLMFEALHCVLSAQRFVAEAHRVLRRGERLLIVNSNKVAAVVATWTGNDLPVMLHGSMSKRRV